MNYESIVVYVRAVNMKKPYQYSYTYNTLAYLATPPLIGSGVLSKVKRDKQRPVGGVSEVLIENSHLWNELVSVRRILIDNNSFKPEVSVIRVSSLSVFKHLLHPRETSESVLRVSPDKSIKVLHAQEL